jgi:hypothetical protein
VIVEIRANEYEMRDANPNVPWAATEIAADRIVRLATKLGCEIATPADVKGMLAMPE